MVGTQKSQGRCLARLLLGLSMGPLIIVVISIAALVFQREGVERQVVNSIKGVIGDKGAEAVGAMLGGAGSTGQGVFATIVGTATLLLLPSASSCSSRKL